MKSGTKKGLGLAAVAAAIWYFFIRKKWVNVPSVGTALGVVYPVTQGRTYVALFTSQTGAAVFHAALGPDGAGALEPTANVSPSLPSAMVTASPFAVVWSELQGQTIPVAVTSAVYTMAGAGT